MKKRILAICLSLVMLLSLLPAAAFAAEGKTTLTVGSTEVDNGASFVLPITISNNTGITNFNITVTGITDGLTLTKVSAYPTSEDEANEENGGICASGTFLAEGNKITWVKTTASTANKALFYLYFTAEKAGEYTIGLEQTADTANFVGNDTIPVDIDVVVGTVKVTAVVTEPTEYAATIEAAATNSDPVRVSDSLKVNVGSNKSYAATEMTITYNSTLVSFDKNNSTIGEHVSVTDNGTGTLTLIEYGSDKAAKADNYVLAFNTKTTAGNAVFAITEAGFGTKDAAVKSDLTDATTLGSVTIEIKSAIANITFADELFYAEQTTVEIGESFTFYPEQTTGGYYDYEIPSVTMEGTETEDINIVENNDGSWTITNVTGDIQIGEAVRSPKTFGNVTYSETTSGIITDKTITATYLTAISFTIPADVAAGVQDGVRYDVSATVDGKTYTLATPTTNEDGSRTYTIPGADVKGAVTVTVTATVLEANKVTVSIGGEASSDGDLGAGSGVAVQVDKTTGSATLSVDTTTGLNKGYTYEVKKGNVVLTPNADGTYTITGLTEDTEITIDRTINVDGVKNKVTIDETQKGFVTLNNTQMWLIQLPNHVDNTTTAVYKYDGQQMFWSADHNNYVIVVISQKEPEIDADKFTLEEVTQTPTIASNNWDVNKSGTVDANDAQLIWNMYSNVYQTISTDPEGATAEKFMLADANHDGVLDTQDAVVIIDKILGK